MVGILQAANPANLAAAIKAARRIETGLLYKRIRQAMQPAAPKKLETEKTLAALEAQVVALRAENEVKRVRFDERKRQKERDYGRRSQPAENRACFICGRVSHIARNCNSRFTPVRNGRAPEIQFH